MRTPPSPTQPPPLLPAHLPSANDILTNSFHPANVFGLIPGPCLELVVLLPHQARPSRRHRRPSRHSPRLPPATHAPYRIPPPRRHVGIAIPTWRAGVALFPRPNERPPPTHPNRECGKAECYPSGSSSRRKTTRRLVHPALILKTTYFLRRCAARVMHLASQAQYTRAMRSSTNSPVADLQDPARHASLSKLHPATNTHFSPTACLSPSCLCIAEPAVQKAVHALSPNSAAGPDRILLGLLHLMLKSQVSPDAGVTGLPATTRLVNRIYRGVVPDNTLPLHPVATLLPVRPPQQNQTYRYRSVTTPLGKQIIAPRSARLHLRILPPGKFRERYPVRYGRYCT